MGTHAKFSASGSERWLKCPASIRLSELAPEPPQSKYAAEGTTAHECLEDMLKGKFYNTPRYPISMVNHAVEAVKWIERRAEYNQVLCETKVSLDFIEPEMFGTVDAAIIDYYGTLTVIDYKYGAGHVVDPAHNSQMIYYALGLAHLYNYDFQKVNLVIIQPRAEHREGTIREWLISVDDLKDWADIFRKGVTAAKHPKSETNKGDHCRWCRAKPICPEFEVKRQKTKQRQIENDFSEPYLGD